jgi:hypothetical protein
MRTRAVAVAAALALAAVTGLAGCAPTVDLNPPPAHANDPHCATVMVQVLQQVGDLTGSSGTLARRDTNAQSTVAWGDPTSVILSCGVTVPTASSLPCVYYDKSIYWLRDKDAAKKVWTFTTYGRNPAVRLTIATSQTPGPILDELNGEIDLLPKNGRVCSSTEDTVTGEDLPPADTASPTPTPSATPAG